MLAPMRPSLLEGTPIPISTNLTVDVGLAPGYRCSMKTSLADEEWNLIVDLLPSDWRELAWSKGAIKRKRGVCDPDLLLQLILMHVATGLSLVQAVTRARAQGLPKMTDVALLKRLRTSEPWLRELARRMFETSRFARPKSSILEGRRIRAVDATTVSEPGATGTDWRVHYCITIPEMLCDFYELTDVKGGETLKRIPVEQGDIVLCDRGYSTRQGVAYVVDAMGDVVVRLNSTALPLLDAKGVREFPLLENLRTLYKHKPSEWRVCFKNSNKTYAARVCAIRKSRQSAERAKNAILRAAKKKGRKVKPDTLELAEYTFVLTTLESGILSAKKVLDLYRARWQIELCFKRLKSLLKLGHLPKWSDDSAHAWIEAKLLTVLLIEALLDKARFFSPWGFESTTPESMEGVH